MPPPRPALGLVLRGFNTNSPHFRINNFSPHRDYIEFDSSLTIAEFLRLDDNAALRLMEANMRSNGLFFTLTVVALALATSAFAGDKYDITFENNVTMKTRDGVTLQAESIAPRPMGNFQCSWKGHLTTSTA